MYIFIIIIHNLVKFKNLELNLEINLHDKTLAPGAY